jgi:uncharacterized protein (TIGR02266 family)
MLPKALGKFRPRTSESRRIPLEREISFRVPRFENFVTEYSANISASGIFVRTQEPLEPGTELTLEFTVADDWQLICGRGHVIWVRTKDESPDAPAGMGIRFLEMDPQSRRLIHWMVDKHAREGGQTFEFEELSETAEHALSETLVERNPPIPSHRGAGHSMAADRAVFARRLFLVVVALGLLALLSWLFLRLTPPGGGADRFAAPAAAAGAPAGVGTEPVSEDAASAGATAPMPAAAASDAARDLIDGWAAAWSDARVEDYISCYSSDFTPPNGLSRSQWRASRGERLTSPRYIRVSITALEIEVQGPDRVSATFFQNYRSERFEDTVRKRMELGREDGGWRILSERVLG